jgi:hypothetical protein
MKPKGGVTLIIAVGGGKPPHHGRSNKDKEEGCEMIKIPLAALAADSEEGEAFPLKWVMRLSLIMLKGNWLACGWRCTHMLNSRPPTANHIEYVEHDAKLKRRLGFRGGYASRHGRGRKKKRAIKCPSIPLSLKGGEVVEEIVPSRNTRRPVRGGLRTLHRQRGFYCRQSSKDSFPS